MKAAGAAERLGRKEVGSCCAGQRQGPAKGRAVNALRVHRAGPALSESRTDGTKRCAVEETQVMLH